MFHLFRCNSISSTTPVVSDGGQLTGCQTFQMGIRPKDDLPAVCFCPIRIIRFTSLKALQFYLMINDWLQGKPRRAGGGGGGGGGGGNVENIRKLLRLFPPQLRTLHPASLHMSLKAEAAKRAVG